MLNTKYFAFVFTAAALTSAMFASTAEAAGGPTGTSTDFGSQVSSVSVDNKIVIAPGVKSINVVDGQTVQFVKNGKSFNWHISTFSGETDFDLAKIAPSGFDSSGIKVYVAADPIYMN